jgi:protein-S-isoprenylcysteine O-methyltransferase Ste14
MQDPPSQQRSLGARVAIWIALVVTVAVSLLFVPAGTWRFWQGWAYLAVTVTPAIAIYLYFLKVDPQVIERRMQRQEQVSEQRRLIRWTKLLFVGAFLLPGLDYRLGWSRSLAGQEPLWLTVFSLAMVLAGMLFAAWVVNVNRFAGRTIRVEAGQTTISTGPYRLVRHPMYLGSGMLCLFTPLALGSWVALPAFALLLPFFAFRLLNEETVLRKELPGYTDYCLRTKWHLIPFVW